MTLLYEYGYSINRFNKLKITFLLCWRRSGKIRDCLLLEKKIIKNFKNHNKIKV